MSDVNQAHLEKLDDLPEGWAESSVSEIVQMISANNKKLAQKKYLEEGVFPVIDQGQDFVGGYSNDKSLVVEEEPPFIVFGDHTRAFKFANFQFVPGADGVKIMKPLGVDPKWCFYIFQAIKLPNKGYARHFQYLKEAYVPVPPPEQQKRIVAKIEELFSHIDAGIEALKKAKKLLKQYRQSVLKAAVTGELTKEWREVNKDKLKPASILLEEIEATRNTWIKGQVAQGNKEASRLIAKLKKHEYEELDASIVPDGWVSVSLTKLCKLVVDCHNKTAPYVENGIPLIRTSNIKEGEINFKVKMKFVNQVTYEYWSRRCPPEPGDILLTREAPMGESAIIPKNTKVCMGQRMMLLRVFHDHTDIEYLHFSLMEPLFQRRIHNFKVGVGVQHLRVGDVEKLVVAMPALSEQREIVSIVKSKLESISRLDNIIHQRLATIENLRQSILKHAFEGKLVENKFEGSTANELLDDIKKNEEVLLNDHVLVEEIIMAVKRDGHKEKNYNFKDIIRNSGGLIKVEELFEESGFTHEEIDEFYEEIKRQSSVGNITVNKPTKDGVFVRS